MESPGPVATTSSIAELVIVLAWASAVVAAAVPSENFLAQLLVDRHPGSGQTHCSFVVRAEPSGFADSAAAGQKGHRSRWVLTARRATSLSRKLVSRRPWSVDDTTWGSARSLTKT